MQQSQLCIGDQLVVDMSFDNFYLPRNINDSFVKLRNSTEYINMVDGFLSEYEEVNSIFAYH